MGQKGKQIRCPKHHRKVGRDLGSYPKEVCYSCHILKICEDRAGKTLPEAILVIEKEDKLREIEFRKEYEEELSEVIEDLKFAWDREISAIRRLFRICDGYGYMDIEDSIELLDSLEKEHKKDIEY